MSIMKFDVTACGNTLLRDAMRLAFTQGWEWHAADKKASATGYHVSPAGGLVFYWGDRDQPEKFPFKMDADGAVEFARRWLEQTEYGPQPDTDGSNKKGWRVYNSNQHLIDPFYVICAVQPRWITFGK